MKNPIKEIALRVGKQKLRSFLFHKEKYKIDTEAYKEYLPMIEECYHAAHYWHGTGRYHYFYSGNSKYEGVNNEKHLDVLGSIIESGGLAPRFDPWITIGGKQQESISLTSFRMYARVYAEFHQYEHAHFLYEYGNPKYWIYFLGVLQLFEKKPLQNIYRALYMNYSKSFVKYSQTWMHTLRADLGKKPITPAKIYRLRSDIKDNYAIVVGIKKEGVVPINFNPIVERFETRSKKLIPLDNITHLEVPLNKVKETEDLLKNKGISLKVLPIEFVEIYLNGCPLEQLSGLS